MIPDLQLAIHLQSLDQRISELEREVAALPKHVAEIEKQLDQHLRRLEADRAALAGNQKERKKLEADVQVQEQKISKLKDQMLSAKTNEVYRAFQQRLNLRNPEGEGPRPDGESDEKNVRAAEMSLKSKEQVEREKRPTPHRHQGSSKLRHRGDRFPDSSGGLRCRRHQAPKQCSGGRPGGLCTACHLSLRPQFFQDVRKSEQVLYCESCGRILYYNPPVVVEEATGSPQAHPAAADS
jgi:hypothetical protein